MEVKDKMQNIFIAV